MAKVTIPTAGLWSAIAALFNGMFDDLYGWSGWGNYGDTQYTSSSPLALAGDTDTLLPNNKGSLIESQLPTDVATFYDGSVINGQNGDALNITVDLIAVPTNAGTTTLEIWLDITGGTGTPANLANLYRRIVTFPKGVGEERQISFTVMVYTLDTWESNGAEVYIRANNTADIYDARYVISRVHKAR